ncbi:MAG: hypothetical protein IJL30_10120 [Clostridia bacterium]|nr:hypothetical protein [Clostridia bacterium]
MKEHIYTIPLNEHFSKLEGCPLCGLFDMMERNEIETVTGASMMEPDVRIKTNEYGFCERHFSQMLLVGKKLPVALILESHINEIYKDINRKKGDVQAKRLKTLEGDCYVCRRINGNMDSVLSNLFYLYRNDVNFRDLFAKQKFFCLPHYRELIEYGAKIFPKKDFAAFFEIADSIEMRYLETLHGDIDWFCRKFDYRFAKEDWKNSKDAIERTVYTLTGHMPKFRSDNIEI